MIDSSERLRAPVAIVDIGSNSVRLVAYESLTRDLTPVFNEKVLCGLGRGVATTRMLAQDGIDKALRALRNFNALCRNMKITDIHVIATAATRDANNGAAFLEAAKDAIGTDVALIGGRREAELAALGVSSSFYRPDGIVGDLGGGSLELIDVARMKIGRGVSLPIGGLALADLSKGSPKRAMKIVRDAFEDATPLHDLKGRTLYAVGGTWRALARLHMVQRNYPLNVMHGYVIPAEEAGAFARLVERVDVEAMMSIGAVSSARRPLLSYGAVVLDEMIRQGRPKDIVTSAYGVREGLLYERLDARQRAQDPLVAAARRLNELRSRDAGHGDDLCEWTDVFFKSAALAESDDERRLRHCACLLADVAWRAHPDYRAPLAMNMIANAAFVGLDHPGRAFLALAVAYRHVGSDETISPELRELLSGRSLDRARVLASTFRVAYLISAGMRDVLPRTSLRCTGGKVTLAVDKADEPLASEKVASRLRQLARLIGREFEV